ncbi:transglutaminase family protein [Nesterenkonia salmonea]|uniref:Transglutaminase family protein n=1 Tax=Nesterenkonia salmonea TaxID=1804987 RepID=A0A5R9BDZ7_9MICC|nr:transglutaminase family protein [Nesterenkonia salmonea]TLP98877.1 transglutaminase family protein [Nesterenkonia salmonea]
MTRLHVVHSTNYSYGKPVTVSYNEARVTPQTDAAQVVLETDLRIAPYATALSHYRDYWGAKVYTFDLHTRHETLSVTSEALVEVHRTEKQHAPEDLLDWDDLTKDTHVEEFSDYLPQSKLSQPGESLSGSAHGIAAGKTPHETAQAIIAWLRDEMEYQPGTTAVHYNAETSFSKRKGVCQDLSHVVIGALRAVGIPARYVSGYIHPNPAAGIGETVAGQSHAWLEWWDGRWHTWDPTNHKPAGDHHILVARGRDYADVTPFKGILSGGGPDTTLGVEVTITRQA